MTSTTSAAGDCRVCAAIRACGYGIAAVVAFSFGLNLLMLAAPLYMLQVYDRVLSSGSMETLVSLTVVTIFALVVLAVLDFARGRMLARIAIWLDQRLAPGLFERAVQSRLRGHVYGTEAINDLATLRGFVTSPGLTALFDLPWTLVFVAAAYLLHPWFGHLAVAAVLLLLVVALLGEWLTRHPVQSAAERGIVARRQLEATARNAEVIEAMGMLSALTARWTAINGQALGLQAQGLDRSVALASVVKLVRLLVQIMTLGLGAWLVLNLQVTGGAMIAASILMTRALGPVEQTVGSWKSLILVRDAVRRMKAFAMEPAYRPSSMPLPRATGALSIEGVVHSGSPLAPPILRGISFQLAAGESLAVIGPSGAGKSTLARLLVGAVRPAAGVVRLDGAEIFACNRDQIGAQIGYLPQDVELFSGTVSDNIARMGTASPEEIVAAAQMADVHELILRLPQGYETQIGEGGAHLSGGQRQRVALARAVLGVPPLVVLDEPNSNLDGDGEAALVRAIAALKAAGSTVVVITHRVPLVQHTDKMLLLRGGQVEVFGPRQEALARLMGQGAAPTGTSETLVKLQKEA